MTATEQQRAALDAIERWLQGGGSRPFYLAGYAGTGKTTLARTIGELVGNTVYAAYTGKAADVMRRKGCNGASTIDALIYTPKINVSCAAAHPCAAPQTCSARGAARCPHLRERVAGRTLKQQSAAATADLIVIDEVSMVDQQMGTDLLSFGVPVLVLGDPAQLPPVYGTGYFTDREPDVLLTEIQRQALDSPVTTLATQVREGRYLSRGQYGDSAVVSFHNDMSVGGALLYDQVICGRNRTRHLLNQKLRRARGYGSTTPEVGEKLICLKNDKDRGLYNGSLWTVISAKPPRRDFVVLVVEEDGGDRRVEVEAPVAGFGCKSEDAVGLPGQVFDYGDVITCHKSQGSQWGSVLVIDESSVFGRDRQSWLYTAVTRAADRVTVAC